MADAHGPLEIPGYRFERSLGSGVVADVFLYTQEALGRPVAVKIMREQVQHEAQRSQFAAEAMLMARLATHPSIAAIFSAGLTDSGRPYMVMEYCSKPSLAERSAAHPLTVAELLHTMIRLSGAVETAHRAGILHHNIKPANVLTTDDGWPALTDFGISAILGEGAIGGGGKPNQWSPPEAFTGAFRVDARADVYSLAATAFTALVGHSPFEDDDARSLDSSELVSRIVELPVPLMRRVDVPDALQRLLAAAMAKSPDERPPTAASFARALQRIEHELLLPATQFDVPDALVDELQLLQSSVRMVDIDDATVVVDRSGDVDDQTVAVDDRTIVFDRADERTIVVDRLDDSTIVVDRADERTIVVDRSNSDAASAIARPERAGITPRADAPVRSTRVAYVPDPDEISRYRTRKIGAVSDPARIDIAPPPQRVAPVAPSTGGLARQRRRGFTGLVVGLSIAAMAIVGAVAVLVSVLGGAP